MVNKHPLQTKLWGDFRKKTGVKVLEVNGMILTIHIVPHTKFTIGYLPKGPDISKEMLIELQKIGKQENCIFIQIEPNIEKNNQFYNYKNLFPSAHSLFTKYNFILDLTKSEEELLKNMHPKTRYNIKLAQKRGVEVIEDNSDKAFEEYLKLSNETTERQKFYAHTPKYHKLMWETLKNRDKNDKENFIPHLLTAIYDKKILTAWILFELNDCLYYPYGASTIKNREVMASNLMMWEAIRFGKKLGLKNFDMWGAANVKDPKTDNAYYGFHKFKQGYGPRHVEYIGSFDYVINKNMYLLYKLANYFRWIYLRIK